ncbi:hypothetical protein Pan241w_20460 [Gimesia alba]|uniref:Uncharacterized protein n=1 Tax=Gimesia alba TaxID=2527973 RepID=A0A517RDM7_9PLAN|nr:hypothetical protein [Gimesia alba]QDT41966.1 hypothetical protein Pan241w_20460 [Gimesia alba]
MKRLMGITYKDWVVKFGLDPKKHYHSEDSKRGFSFFIETNEFLFIDEVLASINIYNFPAASNIPGFVFPVETGFEKLLAILAAEGIDWELYQEYSYEHWVVIKLLQQGLLYEFQFDFDDHTLKLQRVRLERDRDRI